MAEEAKKAEVKPNDSTESEEDDDLKRMRTSFKDQKRIFKSLIKEYEWYKEYEEINYLLEDVQVWTNRLKKAA